MCHDWKEKCYKAKRGDRNESESFQMEILKSCLASFIMLAIIFPIQYLVVDIFICLVEFCIFVLVLTFLYVTKLVLQLKNVKLSAMTKLKSGKFKSKNSLTLNELRLIRNKSFENCKVFTKESLKQRNRKIMSESQDENELPFKPVAIKQASNKPTNVLMEDNTFFVNPKCKADKLQIHEASLGSIVSKKRY